MRVLYYAFISFTLLTLISCRSSRSKKSATIIKKETPVVMLSGPQVTASAKELVRITDDIVAEFQPCLSQDGKQLLYVIRDDAQRDNDKWSIRLKKDVMLPGFTPLIGKRTAHPQWMNSEGDFTFTYYASNPVIATSSINKLGITYVGQNAYGDDDRDAILSPKGDKIVLTTTLQGSRSICLVNRNGSSFTVLSEGKEPKWHPNGVVLLYSKRSGNYYQLFELNLETYQSTQITNGESNSDNGCYSPDGKHVTFTSGKDDSSPHLFVMKRNGQSMTQLTSGPSMETQPFWGSDGFIYFASNAGAKRPKKDKNKASIGLTYSDIWRVKPLIVD